MTAKGRVLRYLKHRRAQRALVPEIVAETVGVKKFDLTTDEWYKNPEKFWTEFRHTGEIVVPKDFEKWLIGQDAMKDEFFMQLEEWVRKMKDIQDMRAAGRDDKDAMRKFLKERPGPYLCYVGPPGTGKSLLIKIVSNKLRELYKKHGIVLQDVLLIENPREKQRPLVRYVPAGLGRRIVSAAEFVKAKDALPLTIAKYILVFLMVMGILAIATGIFLLVLIGASGIDPRDFWFVTSGLFFQWMLVGVSLFAFPMLILVIGPMLAGGQGGQNRIGGSHLRGVPNLVVDNSGTPDLYVDVTQSSPQSMFGGIQHDPYQTGNLGTPISHRALAGAIHRADKKILYADEFKNILTNEQLVIELLTPLEDGAYPIRGRSWGQNAGGNVSIAGETATPVDAAFFMVVAMNYDAIPLLNQYPALRNRFEGYGNIVDADDEMDATPQNEIKIAQFLADEVMRFKTPNLCREAVRIIIGHARRRASSASKMKIQMRPYIANIRKSAQLVWTADKRPPRPRCHCPIADVANIVHEWDMEEAITRYAKSLEMQVLDKRHERRKPFKLIKSSGTAIGEVNGLVVTGDSEAGQASGDVAVVSAWLKPVATAKEADFVATGMPKEHKDTWMANSVELVRTAIYQLYGIDLRRTHYVHINFVQSDPKGIDGPSAGITMTLALMSLLGDPRIPANKRKPVPLRQDTAITGTVELLRANGGDVKVGPIGGVFEKAYGAKKAGILRVIVPQENADNAYFDRFLTGVTVRGASTILHYFDLMRGDIPRKRLVKEGEEYKVVD